MAGFVASPAVGRVSAQSAARLGTNAAESAAVAAARTLRGSRGVGGVLMAAPETTPEGSDTYTVVVVR